MIAGALQPGFLRRALSFRPLVWIGRISYGLYLFHWPLVVWLVPTRVTARLRVESPAALADVRGRHAQLLSRRAPDPAAAAASLPWRRAVRLGRVAGSRAGAAMPCGGSRSRRSAATLAIVAGIRQRGAAPAPGLPGGRSPPAPRRLLPHLLRGAVHTAVDLRAGGEHGADVHRPRRRCSYRRTRRTTPGRYGDPLFCDTPRPNETSEAVDKARALGPLDGCARRRGTAHPPRRRLDRVQPLAGAGAVGEEAGASVAQGAVFGCGVASGEITTTRRRADHAALRALPATGRRGACDPACPVAAARRRLDEHLGEVRPRGRRQDAGDRHAGGRRGDAARAWTARWPGSRRRREGRAGHRGRARAQRCAGRRQHEQRGRQRGLRAAQLHPARGSRPAIPTGHARRPRGPACARAGRRARRRSTA